MAKDKTKKKITFSKALSLKWRNKLANERRVIQIHCYCSIYSAILYGFFYVLDIGIGNLIELFR